MINPDYLPPPWIGCDLDGTLAHYDGKWQGPGHIGAPIPKMVRRVKKWISEGMDVRIMTARVCSLQTPADLATARAAINLWCMAYLGTKLPITAEKDYGMIELWDDRCVQVITNTGLRISESVIVMDEIRHQK